MCHVSCMMPALSARTLASRWASPHCTMLPTAETSASVAGVGRVPLASGGPVHEGEGGCHTRHNSQAQHTPEREPIGVLPRTEMVPSRETLRVPGLEETTPDLSIRSRHGKVQSPQPTAQSSSGSHHPERLTALPSTQPRGSRVQTDQRAHQPDGCSPTLRRGRPLPRVPV